MGVLVRWRNFDRLGKSRQPEECLGSKGRSSERLWSCVHAGQHFRTVQELSIPRRNQISDGGNSGMYFRTTRKPGFTDGYEAQIDSTHTDPIRTGSIYGMCHVYNQLVKPDTWFKYEIEVRDDVWRGRELTRIKVIVDGNELYEYMDFDKTFKEGHFAFQHHDPGSIVHIRKVEVQVLP